MMQKEKLLAALEPMTQDVLPITVEERQSRIDKARRLMTENDIAAIYLEGGSSLFYFTGVRWGRSERMTAAIIPAEGEIAYVCPAFEEARLREIITFGDDVRAWEEDESPYELVAEIFNDRGINSGTIGMEESVRFFLFDGIQKEAPHLEFVSADPVTIPCRAIKSPIEIALIQRAMNITVEAYKVSIALLREGMSQEEFTANSTKAHKALGVKGGISCQFGESTAFPHGSKELTYLKEGDVVLMDGGCTVEGYYSDISRTIVFGEPNQRHRDIWSLEKKAQAAAFAAAQVGAPCEAVDAAARQVITDAGFGPDYKVPGLPHRTGHGIGLDIHEWYNIVRGNKVPLAPGMCFSNEPMIAIYGEFGVRLEDCVYITENGPRYFTQPSPSIEQPFA
ncbi:MAG: aminopeptidase P family protein [Chloroflexi bacterium]|nr:aminopeptidase P family protein [Chloroflexota bacterium]